MVVVSVANMRVLRRSREKLVPGDVFRMLFPDGLYRFGSVVGALPSRSELRPSELLIPPAMINRLPWSRGYFDTIANLPFDEGDVLLVHCFSDLPMSDRNYGDKGNVLPFPVEPVGGYGPNSFRTIDDKSVTLSEFPKLLRIDVCRNHKEASIIRFSEYWL